MTALSHDRNTPYRAGDQFSDPVAAGEIIYAGSFVVLDANGYAAPATEATGLTPRGRADAQVDNTNGTAGASRVATRKGTFRFANVGDIDRTHIGNDAYLVDDQTVSSSSNTNARSVGGTIDDVDDDGVWVHIK